MRSAFTSLVPFAYLGLTFTGSCKDSTSPEPPGPAASFVIVSGDQQRDTVGQELPQPLIARITDASGRSVPEAVVSFVVTSGGGSVFSPAVQANRQGVVQNRWTLGTSTAVPQEVEVRSVNPTTGAPLVFGKFRATALPDRPANLTKIEGDGQQGTAGQRLPNALRVRVTDQHANPVPDVTVAWAVAEGGGTLSATSSTTDATGYTTVEWTLGPSAGAGRVSASVAGLTSQTFSAFAAAGVPAALRAIEGNDQRGVVGTTLATSLAVIVVDANQNPVAGVAVTWELLVSSNGTITPRATMTDANGSVRADWKLGTSAGNQSVRANVSGVGTVEFTAIADPGTPSTVIRVSGHDQSATVATQLPAPLIVRVVDVYGNVIPGVSVTFSGEAGSFDPSSATTSVEGEAQTLWTLPTRIGTYTATAMVPGISPTRFDATAIAGAPTSWAKVAGDDQTGTVGLELSNPPTVRIADQYDNPVAGVTVTWTANGGGSAAPPTTTTSSTGEASTRHLLGTKAGPQSLTARSAGLSDLTFTAAALAGPPVTLEKASGDTQAGGLNQPLAQPLLVRLLDQYGNPVPGQTVAWNVTGGGGSVSPPSAITDDEGLAATTWTLGGTGANRVQAVSGSLTASFAAKVTGLTPASVDAGNFRDRVGAIGRAETLMATVRDAAGVPVSDVTVEWSLTGGTGQLSTVSSVTDDDGVASTTFTPGTVAGSNVVEASVAGVGAGSYLIWTPHLAAARVVAVTGDNQNGVVGQPMPTDIRVRVEDQYGNGVYGDTVRFSVTTGGGYVERTFLVTDTLGYTTTTRWIPGSPGGATLTATASGHSAIFNATVVPSSSPSLFIENQPQGRMWTSLGLGCAYLEPVTVRLVDAAGVPITGASVTWASQCRFGPITTMTDGNGRTTAQVEYSDFGVGVQTVTISAAGASAILHIVVRPRGGSGTGTPSSSAELSGRVGTRIGPVFANCYDRDGAPAPACGGSVRDGPFTSGPGGTLIPAPGYRPPNQRAYYWILPTTPGTYYFCVGGVFGTCLQARAFQ